jgi:IMP dehydrogenase
MNKSQFFKTMDAQGLALTYDDVRLRPSASKVTTSDISIKTKFSRNVELKVPLVSAAMDTVTESAMAIALAKQGGIGVIHAGLSIEAQAEEVRRVKLHLNGLVENPVTIFEGQTVAEVLKLCKDNNFEFRTFPVLSKTGKFVGLITQNDFDFAKPKDLIRHVMTPKNDIVLASPNTSITKAHSLMLRSKKKTLPLLNPDGTVAGLYVFADVSRVTNSDFDFYNLDKRGRLRVAAAVPTDDEALERVKAMQDHLDVVVIDTAQGDSRFAFETLKKLKKAYPKIDVVVGNISSSESARMLAEAGADGIKVGQGPGSICTTRIETGIGVPQVTAVYECVKAVEKFGIPICADGGITNPGDVSVAIASGAHSVMMGSKFAGTTETPGDIITLQNGARVKLFRGMGSPSAIRDSASSRKRYGDNSSTIPLAEGVESYVPDRGPVHEVIDHYVKALRKGMAYVGAENIEVHRKKTNFVRITGSGLRESHPHDVDVIRSA